MKRINPRLVKLHRSYTTFELADLLGVHRNTVRHWKNVGLPMVDGARPALILGCDFQEWWSKRRSGAKRPCSAGQFYCFKCRAPRMPTLGTITYNPRNARMGFLIATCGSCECRMHRTASYSSLATLFPGVAVTNTGGSRAHNLVAPILPKH
jgi:hypothetical protein